MSTASDDAALERLLRVFAQQDEDGRPLYSRDDVRAFLPLLVLGAQGSGSLSEALTDVLRDFAAQLGLSPDMASADVERRVREHYEQHPVNARLLAEVKDLLRAELVFSGGVDAAAAAKALGQAVAKVPVGHGAAPAGSTKASPLARFSFKKDNGPSS